MCCTQAAFISSNLFEPPTNCLNRITTGSSVPFNGDSLPHTHSFGFTPVSTPKPDLQYGFPHAEFTVNQAGVMDNSRINPYAKPSSATYWPFFVVEFKAASRGGTHYVGENQTAGTGAHCVKSVETLFDLTRRERVEEKAFALMVFSCVADAQHATLWVHWRDSKPNEQLVYNGTEFQIFPWKHETKELVDFPRAATNIIDYGVNKRLPEIKEALEVLVEQVPEWNLADRQVHVRSLENEHEAGENHKKKKQ